MGGTVRLLMLFAVLCGVPAISIAYPGFMDGAMLKSSLASAKRVRAGKPFGDDIRKAEFVYGYISGIVDALNNDTSGHFFCQPSSVRVEEDAKIIRDYIDTHPAVAPIMSSQNATLYVFDALGAAFPCVKNPSSK
jgi:hypothetical protein